MAFPLPTDLAPMEAASVEEIPEGDLWQYEPKWDGFRCLAFRDGDQVELRSKAGQPLGRYFPDIVTAVSSVKAKRFVARWRNCGASGKCVVLRRFAAATASCREPRQEAGGGHASMAGGV